MIADAYRGNAPTWLNLAQRMTTAAGEGRPVVYEGHAPLSRFSKRWWWSGTVAEYFQQKSVEHEALCRPDNRADAAHFLLLPPVVLWGNPVRGRALIASLHLPGNVYPFSNALVSTPQGDSGRLAFKTCA